MATDRKLGTFAGVFTPSLVTILGVIMYLRLPRIAGQSGLYTALGIIAAAHVISLCTGASIATIATDRKVGGGSSYYIVSRSLGLPVGGTMGMTLVLGLSFSISLNLIGFSESLLSYWDLAVTPGNIRICASAALIVLTVITLIASSFAMKAQYLVFFLIVLSLGVLSFGARGAPLAQPPLEPLPSSPSVGTSLAIFFPAVTGFTAGIHLAPQLREPHRAIPRGTIAAIVVGFCVYLGLAVFLLALVPRASLTGDPNVLLDIAPIPEAVVAGIWAATLSSALGAMLVAPRILQALAGDGIAPRRLARGSGIHEEPHRALFVSFAIAEIGVLIGDLDDVALVVSIVFLTAYAFLNLSCAVGSWLTADFQPQFRVPRIFSVLGGLLSIAALVVIDPPAALGAAAFVVALWLVLSRRRLTLDAGDAWEGLWSSLVRSGLFRLSQPRRPQQGTFLPNVLVFRPADPEIRSSLAGITSSLVSGHGVCTELELSDAPADEIPIEEPQVGVFVERMIAGDVYETIADATRYRGFAGLRPNTVLLDWRCFREDAARFGELLDVLGDLDKNVVLHSPDPGDGEGAANRIDVWWRPSAGNIPLCLALLQLLMRSRRFRDVNLRFILVSADSSDNDPLRALLRGTLAAFHMDASIRIVNAGIDADGIDEQLRAESSNARLVMLGLPNEADQCGPLWQQSMDRLLASLHEVLLVRASSSFPEVLSVGPRATFSFLPPRGEDGAERELPALELPETAAVARTVSELADAYQRLAARFHKSCVQRVYGRERKLLRELRDAVEKHYGTLDKTLRGASPRRQRSLVNKVQSALLHDCERILDDFAEQGLSEQRVVLEARVESFLESTEVCGEDRLETLDVERPREDFAEREGDSRRLRSFKRRRRWWAAVWGRPVSYRIPIGIFKAYYFEVAVDRMLRSTLRQMVADSHHLMVQLGKMISSPRTSLALVPAGDGEAQGAASELAARAVERRDALLERLDQMVHYVKERLGGHQWEMLATSREIVQALALDIDRIDAPRLARSRQVDARKARHLRQELDELTPTWFRNQQLVVERAKLALKLSAFQHRLSSAMEREKQAIVLLIKNGVLGECERLLQALRGAAGELERINPHPRNARSVSGALELRLDLGRRLDVEHVMAEVAQSTGDLAGELPQWSNTLGDEAIRKLEEGRYEDVETVELPVFRLAKFLVEAKLVGSLQAELERIPRLEQRASGVASDVMRLVAFQLNELETEGEAAAELARDEMAAVVENGIERLETEVEALSSALSEVSAVIDRQLALVLEGTNAYDLGSTTAQLEQHIRRHHGERAVRGARWMLRRLGAAAREGLVNAVYRRSEGLVRARSLRRGAAHPGKLVDRVLALVEEHTPRDEVLDRLPFYYRQLFVGQATVNETFWVGREAELNAAKRAVASARRTRGAVLVIGERGSGKTALMQRMATELLGSRQVYRVFAPRGGCIDPAVFAAALSKSVGTTGSASEVIDKAPEGSVVMVDDLELWWERSPGGAAVLETLLELIARHGERVLFVLSLSTQAFAFMNRFHDLADDATSVLECGPLDAQMLKRIVLMRHGSTGLQFRLGERLETEVGELRLARLFTRHFDYARGVVGVALRSWIAHVERVSESTLMVAPPRAPRWELFDELKPAWVALLIQLVLHKQLDRPRLVRMTGMRPRDLDQQIDTLLRMRLLDETQRGVIEINPYIHHGLCERLAKRGLLS